MTIFSFLPLALLFNGFESSSAGVVCGEGVAEFPLFTLTTFAFPRRTVCAGMGFTTASSRYVAMLLRASEGVMLGRPKKVLRLSRDEVSEYVESRRSPGRKNSASPLLDAPLRGGP